MQHPRASLAQRYSPAEVAATTLRAHRVAPRGRARRRTRSSSGPGSTSRQSDPSPERPSARGSRGRRWGANPSMSAASARAKKPAEAAHRRPLLPAVTLACSRQAPSQEMRGRAGGQAHGRVHHGSGELRRQPACDSRSVEQEAVQADVGDQDAGLESRLEDSGGSYSGGPGRARGGARARVRSAAAVGGEGWWLKLDRRHGRAGCSPGEEILQ